MINRYKLVSRHNPKKKAVDFESPLSVGNGEFAFTADVTGMQTLYKEHCLNNTPLCTMSQWGWHSKPVSDVVDKYTLDDLEMTEYYHVDRNVKYAVEKKKGNEEVYNWLRENPHRLNLGRISLIWDGIEISSKDITQIHQELKLYEGVLESSFQVHGVECRVKTVCDSESDSLGFQIECDALEDGRLKVLMAFPYGSSDITASDWTNTKNHQTKINDCNERKIIIERLLDKDSYYVNLESDKTLCTSLIDQHSLVFSANANRMEFIVSFTKNQDINTHKTFPQIEQNSKSKWQEYWEKGGAVELQGSKDNRAHELERRIVLSQYVLAIQSCGSIPPQETGLTCNSWYGKFHLEMHLWHSAFLPLWNQGDLLKKSLEWYKNHLEQAKQNARRNNYKGARWPKMIADDAIDSPSNIATLLIWQQPHIIYMLELLYHVEKEERLLEGYWEIIKETADFMCDFVVYNEAKDKYELLGPIIPAQEEHEPMITKNPTFEVEYWRVALGIAVKWASRLNRTEEIWESVSEKMIDIPSREGVYLAHENCWATFEDFNKDHPSMLGAYGLIDSDRVCERLMKQTLEKVVECWDFSSMWGWDFALMAMTAVRLKEPDIAIDVLLKDTPKNSYVTSGHNYQRLRKDLPLYLPGNGSLLLVIALMTAGYEGNEESLPGFPKNGMWDVQFENIHKFPY